MHVWRLSVLLPSLLGVVLCAAPAAQGEETAPAAAPIPMLYEVETTPRIYLLGTMHAGDERLNERPAVVQRALAESDVLYTELAFEPGPTEAWTHHVLLPEGESLQEILPAALYERTRRIFAQREVELESLNQYKIWALWLQAQGLCAAKDAPVGLPMDLLLYLDAKKSGKLVGGLEVLAEQVAIFDTLSSRQQIRLLADGLDAVEKAWRTGENQMAALIEIYLRGDPRALLRAMFKDVNLADPFYRDLYFTRMLDQRNVRMVRRMLSKAQSHPEKTTFVAVGAGHLPGRNGILSLLTRTGFGVRKLETVADMGRPWRSAQPARVVCACVCAPACVTACVTACAPRRQCRPQCRPRCRPRRCRQWTTSSPSAAWPRRSGAPSTKADPRPALRSHP